MNPKHFVWHLEGKVGVVTLNRPERKNPLTFDSYAELREQFGTTLPRFDLLAQLERHPEGLKMNELSRLLMVTGGNVTAIVDQLEKEGLVERLDEPADRRAFRIRLTRAGERTFTEWAREHEAWVVGLLSGLSRREQDDLLRLLAKAKEHAVEVTP